MSPAGDADTAVWALTPGGACLARVIADKMANATLFVSATLATGIPAAIRFSRLQEALDEHFARFGRHIFIMATGIVVRGIAGRLQHKTVDPAVVVCDEAGQFAVSLISGHVGGANALAREVADLIGGQAVITTATDVNQKPAVDLIAVENRLKIENPAAIKSVNMALLTGGAIQVHDPWGQIKGLLPTDQVVECRPDDFGPTRPGVFVDYIHLDLPPHVLVLRPASLVVGLGCNRGTAVQEMRDLLEATCGKYKLALASLKALATVDLKADEPGLLALAQAMNLPLRVFSRERLKAVAQVPTPSAMVEKHIGVQSVCEAAALLATHRGRLIVPKQKTANVTVAVAADNSTSSASVPADPTI